MNKKLSTLVVSALMLATSFGASAGQPKVDIKLTSGEKYFLKTVGTTDSNGKNHPGEYLCVKRDSLALMDSLEFVELNRFEKEVATWEVFYEVNVYGEKEYTFKNVKIQKVLSVAKETGRTLAATENGLNRFTWDIDDPEEGGVIGTALLGGESFICKAFTLTNDYKCPENDSTYAVFAKPENGYLGVHFVAKTKEHDAAKADYTPIEVDSQDKLDKANEIVKNIDAAFAKYGVTERDSISYGYSKWASEVVNANGVWLENSQKITVPENLTDTIGVAGNTGSNNEHYSGFGTFSAGKNIKLVVNDNQVAVCIRDTIHGVVIGNMRPGFAYAAGTVFIGPKSADSELELTFATGSGASSYSEAGDINIANGFGDTLIVDPKNDPSYPNDFVLNFASKETDKAEDVAIQLEFGKDAEARKLNVVDNILEGKNLRFVVKNLLVDTIGVVRGASSVPFTGNAESLGIYYAKNFESALMIQDTVSGKFLCVSDSTYDETNNSTNFILKWVDLINIPSSKVTETEGYVKGTSSYNAIGELKDNGKDTTLYYYAGSAVFNIKFDKDSSFVIAPRFLYQKQASGYKVIDNKDGDVATVASNAVTKTYGDQKDSTYYYRLSLKKLGSSAYLTIANTNPAAGETSYPIYLKAGDLSVYHKAYTESDVYFMQYVSTLAANKADNGKYYTADGLKNLTEFEANNHAENQWALYTNEDSTVTILNRETEDKFEINGTVIDSVLLYKGSALKADFDSYITIPGGDTLKLTPVDALYKNNAELGKFVCDTTFNPYSKYTFSYYNGLDNSKKLFFGKDSIMCVDAEGNSAEFALVSDFEEYGADAIDGKSVKLTKYTYKMFTELGKDTAYVTLKDGKYAITKNAKNAVKFDLQEMTVEGDNNKWYTFVESDRSGKASVDDNTLQLFKEELSEVRTSMFTISSIETYDIYRRLGSTIEDGIAKNDTAYVKFFKANEPNRYLYENSENIVAGTGTPDGIGYLGMYNTGDMTRNASIFVDPACVADTVVMPTYMMAVDVTAATDTLSGRYLVSLSDSTRTSAKYNGYTRLAFVNAKHIGDSLIIVRDTAKTAKAVKADTIKLTKDLNKATFAYELTSKIDNNNADADFYIKNVDGYVWVNNGVPVLVDKKEKAVIFNVEKTDVVPTANEEITAEGITVIAGEGFVTVKGAEGKKVVIANILGQTIANTVVSSSEAQIAAPAGVVVVSVEGEKAQKAIVK